MKQLTHIHARKAKFFCIMLFAYATQLGCGKEQASLFEHDHVTPKHWPSSLSDAATKIKQQCGSTENRTMTIDEFAQLLAWVPEVAAETELSEPEWNEVNSTCEAVSKLLLKDKQITDSNRSPFLELATNLENVEKMLLERQPKF